MIFSVQSSTKVQALRQLDVATLRRVVAFVANRADARVLIIKDPRPFPLLDQVLTEYVELDRMRVDDRIVPNPQTADIMAMVADARAFAPDLVLGIGGGSALDSAKAVCAMAGHEGDLDEYLGPTATRKLERRGAKLVLVPTTCGTGAEVTKFGVYTARSGRKYSLANPLLQADAALLVASLVADIPPALLASTAYDAMTHALETLWNKNATPVSDLLAAEALTQLLCYFQPAYDARKAGRSQGTAELLAAACAAGVAFNNTGTAAIHALSFILSEEWHVPHGAACAFFTEDVFAFNAADPRVHAKLEAVAKGLWPQVADPVKRLWDELLRLKAHTGLPRRFADIAGAGELSDTRIAELFDKCQSDFKLLNNVPPMGVEAVRQLVGAKRA
jgi:alcohol dehydrogenase class IV